MTDPVQWTGRGRESYVAPMISAHDVERVARAAGDLPPASGVYIEDDFVMNLLETVLDYQMHTTAVVRALESYRANRWDEMRTIDDVEAVLSRFPDDREGNTALAQYLWEYNHWKRVEQLRGLVRYFRSIGVIDQERLRRWAARSNFPRDFEGRVRGLGIAVYQWLVMRQGVNTVKPDVHVHRFAAAAVGRPLTDREVVEVVTQAAQRIGLNAYELDWRIWEAARGGPPTSTTPSAHR